MTTERARVSSLSVFIHLHIEAARRRPNSTTYRHTVRPLMHTHAHACIRRVAPPIVARKHPRSAQIEMALNCPNHKRPPKIYASSNHTTQPKMGPSALQTHLGAAPVTALRVVSVESGKIKKRNECA